MSNNNIDHTQQRRESEELQDRHVGNDISIEDGSVFAAVSFSFTDGRRRSSMYSVDLDIEAPEQQVEAKEKERYTDDNTSTATPSSTNKRRNKVCTILFSLVAILLLMIPAGFIGLEIKHNLDNMQTASNSSINATSATLSNTVFFDDDTLKPLPQQMNITAKSYPLGEPNTVTRPFISEEFTKEVISGGKTDISNKETDEQR